MEILTEKNGRIVTAVLCSLLFVLGFIIIIPLSLVRGSVSGNCILYANSDEFGPRGVCTYSIVTASIFQIVCCLLRAMLVVVIVLRLIKSERFLSKFDINSLLGKKAFLIGCWIFDIAACFLTLVSGGMVSYGYSVMCNNIFRSDTQQCGSQHIYSPSTSSFVTNYGERIDIVQGGVWISWVFWIVLILVDLFLMGKANIVNIPIPGSGNRNTNQNSSDKPRSRLSHIFRPVLQSDSDTDSAPRTPPPVRPVPPRPAAVTGRPVTGRRY